MLRIICCGRPCFEGLLQLFWLYNKKHLRCGRPCFEGLLQRVSLSFVSIIVVEDLVLKGYYNKWIKML